MIFLTTSILLDSYALMMMRSKISLQSEKENNEVASLDKIKMRKTNEDRQNEKSNFLCKHYQ